MSILQMPLWIPLPSSRNLSSVRVSNGSDQLYLSSRISQLSIRTISFPSSTTIIRMGGGPRTYPGGVSKWQWKRMQAKKAKQLLKARLCRERQIYEMRKRAELKAAVSELERPWEIVERAPTLFSVGADEQLKALADRFQRAGGYDLWSEKDGPQLFQTSDGLPSARFFPKGVVHSIKPYGSIARSSGSENSEDSKGLKLNSMGSAVESGIGHRRSRRSSSKRRLRCGSDSDSDGEALSSDFRALSSRKNGVKSREASGNVDEREMLTGFNRGRARIDFSHGNLRKKRTELKFESKNFRGLDSGQDNLDKQKGINSVDKRKGSRRLKASQVYNMSLQQDGSYGVQTNRQEYSLNTKSDNAVKPDPVKLDQY